MIFFPLCLYVLRCLSLITPLSSASSPMITATLPASPLSTQLSLSTTTDLKTRTKQSFSYFPIIQNNNLHTMDISLNKDIKLNEKLFEDLYQNLLSFGTVPKTTEDLYLYYIYRRLYNESEKWATTSEECSENGMSRAMWKRWNRHLQGNE